MPDNQEKKTKKIDFRTTQKVKQGLEQLVEDGNKKRSPLLKKLAVGEVPHTMSELLIKRPDLVPNRQNSMSHKADFTT